MTQQRLLCISKFPSKKEKYYIFICNSYIYLWTSKLKHNAHTTNNEINYCTKITKEKTQTKASGQSLEFSAWLNSPSPQKSLVNVETLVAVLSNPFLFDLSGHGTWKYSLPRLNVNRFVILKKGWKPIFLNITPSSDRLINWHHM